MTYQEIVEVLAKKYNIGYRDCEKIVDSQFKVLAELIQAKETKTTILPNLGKFTPIKKRLSLPLLNKENETKG